MLPEVLQSGIARGLNELAHFARNHARPTDDLTPLANRLGICVGFRKITAAQRALCSGPLSLEVACRCEIGGESIGGIALAILPDSGTAPIDQFSREQDIGSGEQSESSLRESMR